MSYTFMQLVWLFFIYSFIGWCGEVCMAVISRRKFVNRGFVNGPLCPIYGFAGVLFCLFLPELTGNIFFLFLGGFLISSILEYITGMLMEAIFHRRLWDYSAIPMNVGGYVCLRYSLVWGILSVLVMKLFNPLLCNLFGLLPYIVELIILWVLTVVLLIDFLATAATVLGMTVRAKKMARFTESMRHTSKLMENALTEKVQKRMTKSFPVIDMETLIQDLQERAASREANASPVFARGCSFYKIVSLFFVGAFLGDIVETIYCYAATGILMSRSSVVYGPFSIVWGLGCALLTALLYRYKDKSDRYIFLAGFFLGGAYEYICSVFTELVFGTVFWDYSGFAFNLGGRINLLYCFFWGVAAVVWLKIVYPFLSKWIEKLPKRFGIILCNVLIVFMIGNVMISSLALARYTQRNTSPEGAVIAEESALVESLNDFLDSRFTDERMERIYPNAKIVDNMK